MPVSTPSEILGIGAGATSADAKTAYRLLAMKAHPLHGRGREAIEEFLRVSVAYETLRGGAAAIPVGGLSQTHAERMFAKEMTALAWELSDAGYDRKFIEHALVEEGCPATIAASVARGTDVNGTEATREPTLDRDEPEAQSIGQESIRLPAVHPQSNRGRWLVVSVVLLGCLALYYFAYRPYVAAKEEEARRIEVERARAEESRRTAAARKVEYESCLARLMPSPQPTPSQQPQSSSPESGTNPGRSSFGELAGALARSQGERQRESRQIAQRKLAIAAQETCQRLLQP